jgi:aminoglycoside phosphotransferase (APT) family kinase protein
MLDPDKMPNRLVAFLEREHPGTTVTVDSYDPILGGFSRLTARFRAEIDGAEQWLVARGDPPPEMSTCATDRGTEWVTMRALHEAGTPLPQPLYFDPEGTQLGTVAMVMAMVEGESLFHRAARSDDAALDALADQMVELAIAVHGADLARLQHLEAPADWDSYIDGCIQRWRAIEGAHPEADPFIRYLASWLDENRPPPAPLGLVHGDFQSTNVLVEEDGSFVALDWELTHIGDPREDLGWCKWNEVIQPPGLIDRDESGFCRRYAELSGLGDDIVNPDTVAYFSVLSAIGACQVALPTVAAFAQGLNSSLVTGYVLGYISTFHQQFLEVTKAIEAAEAGKEVSA